MEHIDLNDGEKDYEGGCSTTIKLDGAIKISLHQTVS